MRPIYDSRDLSCKSPFGAVAADSPVKFSIHLPKMRLDSSPLLRLFRLDAEMEPLTVEMALISSDNVQNTFSCVYAPGFPALMEYCFEITSGGAVKAIMMGADNTGTFDEFGGRWQLTVYDSAMRSPSFMREGMMYQIFPDRFFNSGAHRDNVPYDRILRGDWGAIPAWRPDANGEVTNADYFGGDLKGIAEKLDYLVSLGVTIVYMNPVFEAHSNHRYNTADYMKIDPLLGTQEDFAELCAKAKERGISIILDGVFNHTGSDSIYFNKEGRYGSGGAYNDPSSPYFPWYRFSRYPEEYESWWGFNTLPDIDEGAPTYREFICGENGVLRHWLKLGASGYRLDVADELPDDFIDDIAACVKAWDKDCAMLGEVWEDASNKISYGVRRRYLLGKQFDSIMNYPFMNAVIHYVRYGGGAGFYSSIMQIIENYPAPALHSMMNMLSTHDTARALTELVAESSEGKNRGWQEAHHYLPLDMYDRACRLYRLASVLQFGLPGLPCVYYGDEAGLSGYRDPFNRVCYPWGYENQDLIESVAALGRLRREYPCFYGADFIPYIFSDDACVFIRDAKAAGKKILFGVNRSDSGFSVTLPPEFAGAKPYIAFGEYADGRFGPFSGVVLIAE